MDQIQNAQAEEDFSRELAGLDWNTHLPSVFDVGKTTAAFHEILSSLTAKHFPVTWHKVHSTDDPLIDAETRAMIKKRRDLFSRTQKRCHRWKKLKKTTKTMIRNRKKKFYDKEIEKLSQEGSHQIPYKLLKNIADTERPPAWSVKELAEGRSDSELAEHAADYFSSISQEFPPLDLTSIPTSYDLPVEDIRQSDIADRLCRMKKPGSSVEIDPLSRFLVKHAAKLSEVLTPIINSVRRGMGWPGIWKEEEGTIIPKKNSPTNINECRNISCTSIFSKLCESYLMDMLTSEITLDGRQFGGVKRFRHRLYVGRTRHRPT